MMHNEFTVNRTVIYLSAKLYRTIRSTEFVISLAKNNEDLREAEGTEHA